MLFDELTKITNNIKRIDPQRDAPAFAREIVRRNAAVLRNLKHGPDATDAEKLVLLGLAAGCIGKLIRPMPAIVDLLASVLRDTSARRCSLCCRGGARVSCPAAGLDSR